MRSNDFPTWIRVLRFVTAIILLLVIVAAFFCAKAAQDDNIWFAFTVVTIFCTACATLFLYR